MIWVCFGFGVYDFVFGGLGFGVWGVRVQGFLAPSKLQNSAKVEQGRL